MKLLTQTSLALLLCATASGASWTPTGSMSEPRYLHTATLLANGKVLIAGGLAAVATAGAELYDPATGSFAPTAPLITARSRHAATLLPNGKVLVTGGYSDADLLSSAELYDPATGSWTAAASMLSVRGYHSATLLANGKVLVAGGYGPSLGTAELYDPATNLWTPTGSMSGLRSVHSATLLPNGRVLVAGGVRGTSIALNAELYDPATGTWTATGSMASRRYYHASLLLGNGKVLTAAGNSGEGAISPAEIYDPALGRWTATAPLATPRFSYASAVLSDGKALILGGTGPGSGNSELYDPATGLWTLAGALSVPRSGHTATLLANGKVLAAGGSLGGGASAEIYESADVDAVAPTAAPSASPLPNGSGWNNVNVTVNWNWSDNVGGSGIDAANCNAASVVSTEGVQPLSATCRDRAGNTGNASFTVKLDKTPPTVTASGSKADGTPYTPGAWTNQTVTVRFTCADLGGSSLATCPGDQIVASGETPVGGSASDHAGNTASSPFLLVRVDKTSPTIAALLTKADGTPYGAGTWSNQTVTVKFICSDGNSGIGGCPANQVFAASGQTAAASVSVTDAAGNSASTTFGPVRIDKTVPVLNPVVSPNPAMLNAPATATSGAVDAHSGVATQSCAPVDTTTAGSKTVVCTATDNAGNTATVAAPYVVGVAFSGFQSPVLNPPGINFAKAGKTVPVKWQLRDGTGGLVTSIRQAGTLTVKPTSCAAFTANPAGAVPAEAAGNTATRFDDGKFIFNWATPRPGCYTLFLTLPTGQTFPSYFSLEGKK